MLLVASFGDSGTALHANKPLADHYGRDRSECLQYWVMPTCFGPPRNILALHQIMSQSLLVASIPELTECSPPVQASRISTKRGVHRYANTPSHVLLARGHARVRNGRWPHRDRSAFCGTKAAKDVQITTDDASGLRENRQARQPAASHQSCDAAVTHREAANISKESLYVSSGTPI